MIAKIFIFISCPIFTLTDLYYVGVQDGNLPSANVNIVYPGDEHVARVQYGDNVVSAWENMGNAILLILRWSAHCWIWHLRGQYCINGISSMEWLEQNIGCHFDTSDK